MRGVGQIDDRGRLVLVVVGLVGAAAGALAVFAVLTTTGSTWGTIEAVMLPVALLGAAVGVAIKLHEWRASGGFAVHAMVQSWIDDGRVPFGVPAEQWVPLLERQAERREAARWNIVVCSIWIVLQGSRVLSDPTEAPVFLTLTIVFWAALGAWEWAWVLRRSTIARGILARGVATEN